MPDLAQLEADIHEYVREHSAAGANQLSEILSQALAVHRGERSTETVGASLGGIWSKTPGTQVQHRLIEAAARWRNGGNTGFSLAPPSAVPLTFHNLPGVFDHVRPDRRSLFERLLRRLIRLRVLRPDRQAGEAEAM